MTGATNLTTFGVRNLVYSGVTNYDTLYRAGSTTGGLSATRALRPVITLKSNVYIASGSGTRASPYILGVGGPESTGPYTISLFAALPTTTGAGDPSNFTVSQIKVPAGGTATLSAPEFGGTVTVPNGTVTLEFNEWISDNSTWTIQSPRSATTTVTAGTGDVLFTATYAAYGG